MTEAIYGWMRGIACYFIFMTAVLNCLPDDRYRKYVKSFLGLILMLVFCGPVLKIFSLGDIISENYRTASIQEEVREIQQSAELVKELQEDYLVNGYEEEIRKQMENLAGRYGLKATDTQVILEDTEEEIKIRRVNMRVEEENQEDSIYQNQEEKQRRDMKKACEKLKDELVRIYELEEQQVRVTG